MPKLKSMEVVVVHCNLVNKNYQQASKVLFTFVLNRKFSELTTNVPHTLTLLNTTYIEFSSIQV